MSARDDRQGEERKRALDAQALKRGTSTQDKPRCIMLGCSNVGRRLLGGYCKSCDRMRRESMARQRASEDPRAHTRRLEEDAMREMGDERDPDDVE